MWERLSRESRLAAAVGGSRASGDSEIGNLIPVLVTRVLAGRLPIVQQRDDLAVVGLVNSRNASARQQPAGQTAEDSHRGVLDPGARREV
jgi:hypothetical protein